MKIAVIGSRNLKIKNIENYIFECDEIVSGGVNTVGFCASEFAHKKNIKLTEFYPEYERYGRSAPMVRNKEIVDYADKVIVFWNGYSNGAESVIKYAEKQGKDCEVVYVETNGKGHS